MASTQPVILTKRKHHKTRAGCVTCKKRRVKCDETKPECRRCQAYGTTCEGYDPPRTWVFDPPGDHEDVPSYRNSLALLRPTQHSPDNRPKEARAVQYFTEVTSSVLAAFNSASLELWKEVMPQVGQTVKPLRDLMISLASRQERAMSGNETRASSLELRHHRQALVVLTDRTQQPTTEIMLMCCLLFIACENLEPSGIGTLPHLRAGLNMLREWESNNRNSDDQQSASQSATWIRGLIEPTFARLEAAAGYAGHLTNESRSFDRPYDLNWAEPRIPDTFSDLIAVRESFHDICQYLYFQSKQHSDFYSEGSLALQKIRRLYYMWHEAAWKTSASSTNPNSSRNSPATHEHKRGLLAFEAHYQTVMLMLSTCTSPFETIYDSHLARFSDILRICTSLFDTYYSLPSPPESTSPESNTSENSPLVAQYPSPQEVVDPSYPSRAARDQIFAYPPGMVPPLSLLGFDCRDPVLRRGAMTLLKRMHAALHGPDDECVTALIIRMVTSLEEANLPTKPAKQEDIPEANRVRLTSMELRSQGTVILTYRRSPYAADNEETISAKVKAKDIPTIGMYWSILIESAQTGEVTSLRPIADLSPSPQSRSCLSLADQRMRPSRRLPRSRPHRT